MKQNIKKLTAFAASAAITLSGTSVTALAAKDNSKTNTFVNKEAVGTTGFAVCEDAVNIREAAGTDSSIVGAIKSLGSVEIVDVDESGWYQIKSGDVEGYISAEYVATGNNAEELRADAGYTTAEVGAEILNIRKDADSESDIVAIAGSDEKLEVVEDNGDWIKVVSGDGVYGWVSCEYVYTSTEYATAVPIDELEEVSEETAYTEDNTYAPAAEADYTDYSYTDYTDYSYTDYSDYSYTDTPTTATLTTQTTATPITRMTATPITPTTVLIQTIPITAIPSLITLLPATPVPEMHRQMPSICIRSTSMHRLPLMQQ